MPSGKKTARAHHPASTRPIVTLTSDFGTSDAYVAAMKAAVLRHCPDATLIDITHDLPRGDVLAGSIALERAIDAFAAGAVHLAVVDPGVGSQRRAIVARLRKQWIVCPDNGLLTWPLRRHGTAQVFEITDRPARLSDVFHGRDLFAPMAGRLAAGARVASLARPIDDPILRDLAISKSKVGTIIHIDHFGNATTNLPRAAVGPRAQVVVNGRRVGGLRRTYSDVAPGKPLALIGSSDLLEIAMRDGSAAKKLRLRVGDRVTLK